MILLPIFVKAAIFAALGRGLGAVHFGSLWLNTGLYLNYGFRGRAAAVHALRMVFIASAWIAVARFGAIALVGALGGLLVARGVAASRVTRGLARGADPPATGAS